MTDGVDAMDGAELLRHLADRGDSPRDLNVIVASRDPREWQCIECGFVVERERRPGTCPHCNCVKEDVPAHVNLFVRREACGWFE